MARVHKYILKLKEADKIKSDESEKAKAANPFDPKDNKVQMEECLRYAEDGKATQKLHLREFRRHESAGQGEFEDAMKIPNFMSRPRWSQEKDPQGGITWLDFFIWCQLHTLKQVRKPLSQKGRYKKKLPILKSCSEFEYFLPQ